MITPFSKVTIKHLCIIYTCSKSKADKIKKIILSCLENKKTLTFNDLAIYERCTVDYLKYILNQEKCF